MSSRSDRCSVVLMNWRRPANIIALCEFYASCKSVAEIVVVDPSPICRIAPAELPKGVQHIELSSDPGLYVRFAISSLCHHEPVLIADDDLMPSAFTVASLLAEWNEDPCVLHGVFGRKGSAYRTGTIANAFGEVEIVLTRIVVTLREYCATALRWGIRQTDEMPQAMPRGNGEDITLSFVAMAKSGKLNRAHRLPVAEMRSGDEAIYRRFKRHREHRQAIVEWCQRNSLEL